MTTDKNLRAELKKTQAQWRRCADESAALRVSLEELYDYLRDHGSARDTYGMLLRAHMALHPGEVEAAMTRYNAQVTP